jgi:hypothetical protein
MKHLLLSAAFLATIPAANWMVGHVGTVCPPGAPCMVPVWPWPEVLAPSGSVLIGVALVLRNVLQQSAPRAWILGCIVLGAALSALVAPAALTVASATSFLFSEMTDWAVYSPLRRRNLAAAILAAGLAGAIVDASLFVSLAFGAKLSLIGGQVIAKLWASVFTSCVLTTARRISLPR